MAVGIGVEAGASAVVGMVCVAEAGLGEATGSRVRDGGASPWVQAAAINADKTTRHATNVAFTATPVWRGGRWSRYFSSTVKASGDRIALYR